MATYFTLNTGARIPSVGLGTYKAGPGVVADAITAAVKVLASPSSTFCSELYIRACAVPFVLTYAVPLLEPGPYSSCLLACLLVNCHGRPGTGTSTARRYTRTRRR